MLTVLLSRLTNKQRVEQTHGACGQGVGYIYWGAEITIKAFTGHSTDYLGYIRVRRTDEEQLIDNPLEVFMYLELLHQGIKVTEKDVVEIKKVCIKVR